MLYAEVLDMQTEAVLASVCCEQEYPDEPVRCYIYTAPGTRGNYIPDEPVTPEFVARELAEIARGIGILLDERDIRRLIRQMREGKCAAIWV